MKQTYIKLFVALSFILIIVIFYSLDLHHYLTLDYLKSQQSLLKQYSGENPWLTIVFYFIAVFLLSALSLPGVVVLIMIAGLAFFNFWTTLIVASFADSLGSTAAFLISRYLFSHSIQKKYPNQLAMINKGVKNDGGFYLFSLRLMIFFPCFMINLLMGLTSLRIWTFYWVTQIGKLPYKVIFTYTGTELGQLNTPAELLSPQLIIGFTLIGLFPLLSKKCLQWLNLHKSTVTTDACQKQWVRTEAKTEVQKERQ